MKDLYVLKNKSFLYLLIEANSGDFPEIYEFLITRPIKGKTIKKKFIPTLLSQVIITLDEEKEEEEEENLWDYLRTFTETIYIPKRLKEIKKNGFVKACTLNTAEERVINETYSYWYNYVFEKEMNFRSEIKIFSKKQFEISEKSNLKKQKNKKETKEKSSL